MKLKNLEKKVRRLEARLRAGPKKLAKLKRRLDSMSAAKARKARKKAAARAVARQTVKSSMPTQKTTLRMTGKPQAKPTSTERPSAPKKVKRKLNLSPERRAQLAAAMKARWAAKKAAEANPPGASVDQGSPSP